MTVADQKLSETIPKMLSPVAVLAPRCDVQGETRPAWYAITTS